MESHESILDKIANGIYKICPKQKGKSQVWKVFSEVKKDDATLLQNVVFCRICNHILKFNGKQTSNLVRHKIRSENRNNLQEILLND